VWGSGLPPPVPVVTLALLDGDLGRSAHVQCPGQAAAYPWDANERDGGRRCYNGVVETSREPSETVVRLLNARDEFLGFLEKRLGDRAAAEDVLQAAYVRSLDAAEHLEQPDSVIAWFYRVLRNAVADRARRRQAEARAVERAALEPSAVEDEALEREVCACVGRLLPTLKPEYAAALEAVELRHASVAELAASEGITANNASVRLHRARQALRRKLEQTCGACSTHGCVDCTCGDPAAGV
jgi:RNA polymerase sigma factor (sigma-70 family)